MKIVLFDGICKLCNYSVKFIIKKDLNNHFKFSSLQSEFSKKTLAKNHLNHLKLSTIVLIEQNQVYTKSTAVLKILTHLKGYKWTRFFLFIPKSIRDFIYDLISRNRYSLFGKNNSCMIPSKDLAEKFIESA